MPGSEFISPGPLIGIGLFLLLCLTFVWAFMNGKVHSDRSVQRIIASYEAQLARQGEQYDARVAQDRDQYEARIAQEHEIGEMFHKAYDKVHSGEALRIASAVGMMVEQSKTVSHALEELQNQAEEGP